MKRCIILTTIILTLSIAMFIVACLQYSKMSKGDINMDGKVDALDISIVLNNWSK